MLRKLLSTFYLFTFLSFSLVAQVDSLALDKRISVQFNNTPLSAAIRQISRIAQVNFSYNSSIVPRSLKVTQTYQKVSLRQVLNDLLKEASLYYREVNGNIVILEWAFSEKALKGRVVDAKTKESLPYANVFISNSTLGDATDKDGNFYMENIPDQPFDLIVSYVGYETKMIPFSSKQAFENTTFIIEMDFEGIILNPIQVSARRRKKRKKENKSLYSRFETEFLGRADNAKKCKVINPQVLEITVLDSLDNFKVLATEPLFVENHAMGYRIEYLLKEFSFVNGVISRIGQAKFKELEPGSRRQHRQWKRAREKAYNGSATHFLKALINNELTENGFKVNIVQYDSVNGEYTSPLNSPELSEILTLEPSSDGFQYTLISNEDIEITYMNEYEDPAYVKLYRSHSKSGNYKYTDRKSRSSITLNDSQKLFSYQTVGNIDISSLSLFQKSVISFRKDSVLISYPGYFVHPKDAVYLGWWAWGGFSEALPLNYNPPKKKDEK